MGGRWCREAVKKARWSQARAALPGGVSGIGSAIEEAPPPPGLMKTAVGVPTVRIRCPAESQT